VPSNGADPREAVGAGNGRRAGRRPGVNDTRSDIIRAAQKLFAEKGYHGASMRAIAQEADVDAALIHYFFTSKEVVFAAAIEDGFLLTELIDTVLESGVAGLGERLVRGYLDLWNAPASRDPMLAVMRSALSYGDAARLLAEFISSRVVRRLATAIDMSHPDLRGTLVGGQLFGLAIARYVIKVEPLASAAPDVVVCAVGPTIDRYLTGPIDLTAAQQPSQQQPSQQKPSQQQSSQEGGSDGSTA
jgi:AcrR family transcriptional regulator